MPAPDPEGMSLLAKAIAAGVAVIAPVWGVRTWLEKRFDKKADKHQVASQFQKVENEMALQRGTIGKVFDQIRENEQRAQDRHERLMQQISERSER